MDNVTSQQESILPALRALTVLGLALVFIRLIQADAGAGSGTLVSIGLLVLAGTAGGHLASLIGLPKLTGFLIAGLVVGPSGFSMLSEIEVKDLSFVRQLALATISLQAGAKFTNEMLRSNFKSLIYGTFSHVLVMALGMTAVVYFVSAQFGWLGEHTTLELIALASLLGALAVPKSPSSVVAVLTETRAQGPLADHALGIVVMIDVIVLALFSVVLVIARSALDPHAVVDSRQLQILASDMVASLAAGCSVGLLIGFYLRFVNREKILFLLLVAYGISAFCRYFGYDAMLVFVMAGYIVTNVTGQKLRMTETITSVSSIVLLIFFATAGASLHLHQLQEAWKFVAVVFFTRIALTVVASRLGASLAGARPPVRTLGFTPFVSQAGAAISLAILVGEKIPGAGAIISTVGMSFVSLNEVAGPILFKWGLRKAGDSRDNAREKD